MRALFALITTAQSWFAERSVFAEQSVVGQSRGDEFAMILASESRHESANYECREQTKLCVRKRQKSLPEVIKVNKKVFNWRMDVARSMFAKSLRRSFRYRLRITTLRGRDVNKLVYIL